MTKQEVLNNVEELDVQQLIYFIKDGTVTLDELKGTGNLDSSKRQSIQKVMKASAGQEQKKEEEAWSQAKYGDEPILRNFISQFPNGQHASEAKSLLDGLIRMRELAFVKHDEVIANLKADPNSYKPFEIQNYLSDGTVTRDEIVRECEIPASAIDNINNILKPNLQIGETPESIPEGFTEVYFWGYPGCGKTCALGAVLSMAQKMGYLNIAPGPGMAYAMQLKNIFSDNGTADDFLPAPSPVEVTQYLPFSLQRPDEKYPRNVSLIELSGEIFKCFLYKNSGRDFDTQEQMDTFSSLDRFLKSKNRKVHFFFIDYSKNNRADVSGFTQGDYLSAASTYFQRNNIFGKSTDAIFVVLTKSDLLRDENGNPINDFDSRVEAAKKHLQKSNYLSFINTLKMCCKKNSINAGRLTVEPFSLGKVYFNDICNFDGAAAERIVRILLERIPTTKKSFMDVLNK